ncbi:CAP-Gly domain-containing linker protein 3-like [Amphiura filiformis]|uniref:CAP-Gly domain-containing linker protein 3-like n=1 Tax=Amphiura filiformis TaxID=82378 RepID=UPI003B226288
MVETNSTTSSLTKRATPIIHPPEDAPMCTTCKRMKLTFFDPSCTDCLDIVQDPDTTVAEIFAIIRQWIPQVQEHIFLFGQELLSRDFHLDDRDGLTDMTLLHYACKAGSHGFADGERALKLARQLLRANADPSFICYWTGMNALHYAAFFNAPQMIELLLEECQGFTLDIPCSEFYNGSCLHIAASVNCVDAVKCLLKRGANVYAKDSIGRIPMQCVAENCTTADPVQTSKLRQLLVPDSQFEIPKYENVSYNAVPSKVILASQGFKLGDRVSVGESKIGILRFCGKTRFASGLWAGIELQEAEGKNDGSIRSVQYFTCPPNHGVFAPLSKVSHLGTKSRPGSAKSSMSGKSVSISRNNSQVKIDLSQVSPKVDTGLRSRSASVASMVNEDLDVGDEVMIGGRSPRQGIIQYKGTTKFAPGYWYGIELSTEQGKNDGSIAGVRYFTCKPNHGVFAPASKLVKSPSPGRLMRQSSAGDSMLETSIQEEMS